MQLPLESGTTTSLFTPWNINRLPFDVDVEIPFRTIFKSFTLGICLLRFSVILVNILTSSEISKKKLFEKIF